MTNQKGAALIWVIAALVVLGGGAAAYVATDGFSAAKQANQSDSASNQDATDDSTDEVSEADQLPDWFAANYHVYPGSKVSTVSGGDGARPTYIIGYMVSGKTEPGAVTDWYREQYSKDGWVVVYDKGQRLTAQKGGPLGYGATINVIHTSTSNVVTLAAAKQFKPQ